MPDRSGQVHAPTATPTSVPTRLGDQEMSATVVYPDGRAEQQSTARDSTSSDQILASGTLLKHFRIMKLVGRGGMGDVYEAHDESLERTVAIKRLEPTTRLPAAILPRAQAWIIDLILLTVVLAVVGLLQPLLGMFDIGRADSVGGQVIHFGINLARVFVFGLLTLAHGKWKTTPGKRLFQISLTDQHGLPLSPIRLMLRLLLSELPISLGVALAFLDQFTGNLVGWWIGVELILSGLWLVGNVVAVLIDKRRLALHDRLLGTRVVVDHAG